MRVVLEIVSGPARNRKFWLREQQSLTVGRTPRSDFVIAEDRQVSSEHFSLTCDLTRCVIRDLNSTNGTFVNQQRVQSATLQDGDVVRAGASQFTVRIEGLVPSLAPGTPAGESAADATAPSSTTSSSTAPSSTAPSSTALNDWHVAQYDRFLDEAGFLYAQRLSLLEDPETGWMDVNAFEKRLEAHIDGLAVGADLALDVCRRRLADGEAGTLYAATRVILRRHRRDLFEQVVSGTDVQDAERIGAVANAARDGFPPEWNDLLLRDLPQAERSMKLALLKVLALRRANATPLILELLRDQGDDLLVEVIRTLGQLGDYAAHDDLVSVLRGDATDRVKSASATALLHLGAEHVIGDCLKHATDEAWPLIPLGYSGGAGVAAALIKRAEVNPHPDGLLALGLLGMIRALNALWEALPNEECGAAAALALHLITGAELYEEEAAAAVAGLPAAEMAFVEDDTVLARPVTTSATVPVITRDQVAWEQWWRRHRERFRQEKRYRLGRLYAPNVLVSMLLAAHIAPRMRQVVLDELMIRYNLEYPFATDLFVVDQQQQLRQIDEWGRTFGCRFEPGQWFFDGRLTRQ